MNAPCMTARPTALAVLMLLAGLTAADGAPAQSARGLADPTQPPSGWLAARAPAAPSAASPLAAARPAPAAVETTPIVVQAIHVRGGHASALIDGRLVRAGDLLGGRRVLSIDQDGVLLAQGDRPGQRLRLLAAESKLPPGSIRTLRGASWNDGTALAATDAAAPTATAGGPNPSPNATLVPHPPGHPVPGTAVAERTKP